MPPINSYILGVVQTVAEMRFATNDERQTFITAIVEALLTDNVSPAFCTAECIFVGLLRSLNRRVDMFPLHMIELAVAVADTKPDGVQTPNNPAPLPIGTKVRSDMDGRATGEIVGYNTTPEQGFYNASRYPYVIRFEDGWQDYYGIGEHHGITALANP